MRIYTKEYYNLFMKLGTADMYEPAIDKEVYTDEDIEALYQEAMDRYIEEERADYDAPPEAIFDDDIDPDDFDPEDYTFVVSGLIDGSPAELDMGDLIPRHPRSYEELREIQGRLMALAVAAYEAREPFDEEEAKAEFEEMVRDNMEDPDEDLPEWVREKVDPRMLAMYLLPEKIYRKLAAEDEANQAKFDALDEEADKAREAMEEALPEELCDILDFLEEMEGDYVINAEREEDVVRLYLAGWNDEGEQEVRILEFTGTETIEDDDISIESWDDEDGESESDCDLVYSEIYLENGKPEIHLLLDNNGLKYFTFKCDSVRALRGWNNPVAVYKC